MPSSLSALDSPTISNFGFYLIGAVLILLGVAFFLIPLLSSTGALNNVKIPWFLLYVYKSSGFYFVTSPVLILITLITIVILLARR
jgi:hypothetical protein